MEKNKKGSILTRLFHIAKQGKGFLFVSCLLATIGMVAGIVPYVSVYFVAKQLLMPSGGGTQSIIFLWVIVAGIGIICNMLFSFLGSYGAHKVAFKILYGFRIRVIEHLAKVSIGFFADHSTGSIQKTMDENIEKIEGFIAHMLPDMVGSAAVLLVLFSSLFLLSPWIALGVFLAIMVSFLSQFLLFGGKKGKSLWVAVANASRDTTSAFSEYVKGIAEVKLFGLTGTVTKSLDENIEKYKSWELKQYKRSAPAFTLYKTIVLSLLSIVLPIGVLLIAFNPGDTGMMLSVLMALIIVPAIYDPLMTCISYGTQMGQLSVGLDAIDTILETKPIASVGIEKKPAAFDVVFDNVSFSYQAAGDPLKTMALSHLSFRAKANEMMALVGPSGGGKSTVGQLLSRFWDVNEGSIKIGGIDIRSIKPTDLMDLISVVFQDTFIFSDTVYDNLVMNHTYTKEQVVTAAKAAQCHDFIMALPNGYETKIGSEGTGFSGGEAQRLAIARCILKDAPIVVLDEALAYSDAENENLIQKAIEQLVLNKTVIIIAHRLQSIQGADQILLLDKGVLTEQGTHEGLLNEGKLYNQLWHIQHEADAWTIDAEED